MALLMPQKPMIQKLEWPSTKRRREIGECMSYKGVEGDLAHFLLLTLWQSEDAIKRFAGSEMEKAKYYPEDEMFLLELEPKVMHYEVLVQPSQCKSQTDIKWLRMASRDRIISFERCCDENIASNFY